MVMKLYIQPAGVVITSWDNFWHHVNYLNADKEEDLTDILEEELKEYHGKLYIENGQGKYEYIEFETEDMIRFLLEWS